MNVLKLGRTFFLATISFTVVACGGSEKSTPTDPPIVPVVVGSVTVTPSTLTIESGDTARLTAVVRSATGQTLTDRTVAWTTAPTTVATVSASGLVTAVAPGGPLTISATVEGVTGTAQVTTTLAAVSNVTIASTQPTVIVGAQRQLTATLRDARGASLTGRAITWASSDLSKLTVTNAGVVSALALGGPVTLTAVSEGKQATVALTVVMVPVARVVLNNPLGDLNEGASVQLSALVSDSAGGPLAGRTIVWSSDSASVATVDAAGTVKTLKAGVARIRARVDNVEATIDVKIHGLLHRWTFTEQGGAGTTFRDDVSGATASIVRGGTLAATAVGGQVTLTGGAKTNADYVALPASILAGKTDVTIEIWATLHSLMLWSRVFDIGSSSANNLFVAWSQGVDRNTDRTGFNVNATENRLDNAFAPFTIDLQHHLVVSVDEDGGTGGKTRVSLFLDGKPRGSFETTYRMRDLVTTDFWLGRSHFEDATANASYDEVRIHDRVYSNSEIQQSFVRGPIRSGSTSLKILPPVGMRDTIRGITAKFPLKLVGSDALGRQFQVAGAKWQSSNTAVATVDSTGAVKSIAAGRSTFTATVGTTTANWVADVVRVRRVAVDPYLATPIAGALWEVPVVLIEYLPSADGATIDTLKNPDFYNANPMTLDSTEKRILTFAKRRKMGVEQGSRFRGYKDNTALPSLGYRVVDHFIVYDLTPPSNVRASNPGSPAFPDWFRIFSDLQLDPIMRSKVVREIWMADGGFDGNYPSYNKAIHDTTDFRTNAESNMSSPTTGDISNSFRIANDLPILGHTYIAYSLNYRRTQAEAMHNVGHQVEAMLGYVSARQTGNDRLFWRDFVGQDAFNKSITGRAGSTHIPPNTTVDYDYLNTTSVQSDIEDWRPDNTGTKKSVNVNTWGNLQYPWPGETEFDQRVESQWYTYWWQNFPGRGNRIPHPSGWMTNWWAFVGNWDAAITSGLGLYSGTPAAIKGFDAPYTFFAPASKMQPEIRPPAKPESVRRR